MKELQDEKGTVATTESQIKDAIENLEPNGEWFIIEK